LVAPVAFALTMALFRAQGYSGHVPKLYFLLPERSGKLRETMQESCRPSRVVKIVLAF